MAQNRSAGNNEAWRVARSVSRGSLNRLLADLEVINADSAMEAGAMAQSITFRVPYAFGVACTTSIPLVASVLPVDNSIWAAARFRRMGVARRGQREIPLSHDHHRPERRHSRCLQSGGVHSDVDRGRRGRHRGAGRPVRVAGLHGNVRRHSGMTPTVGMPVILLQRVRYRFAPSVALAVSLPGSIALWRDVIGGSSEELAAPFDTTARFRFYVTGSDIPQDAVPSPITMTRGIELHLDGMSETVPQGSTTNKRMHLTTSIFFKNRRD